MLVKVIKGSGAAWWRDFIGETFEVKEISGSSIQKTHYSLTQNVPGRPYAFAISKKDCIILEGGSSPYTNKSLSFVLDKEY